MARKATIVEKVAAALAARQRAHERKLAEELRDFRERQLEMNRAGDNTNAERFSRLEDKIDQGHDAARAWRETTGKKVDDVLTLQSIANSQCQRHHNTLYGPQENGRGLEGKTYSLLDARRYATIAISVTAFLIFIGWTLLDPEVKARGIFNPSRAEMNAAIDERLEHYLEAFRKKYPLPTTPKNPTTSENHPTDPDP